MTHEEFGNGIEAVFKQLTKVAREALTDKRQQKEATRSESTED